uniref:Uncharacterized protein n=1 Tax=Mycena chlorophos TaxID=658473 RepID=A0ABQ0KYY8_MYCCL|nr:predicted protein [Mycena chlorophos]
MVLSFDVESREPDEIFHLRVEEANRKAEQLLKQSAANLKQKEDCNRQIALWESRKRIMAIITGACIADTPSSAVGALTSAYIASRLAALQKTARRLDTAFTDIFEEVDAAREAAADARYVLQKREENRQYANWEGRVF